MLADHGAQVAGVAGYGAHDAVMAGHAVAAQAVVVDDPAAQTAVLVAGHDAQTDVLAGYTA